MNTKGAKQITAKKEREGREGLNPGIIRNPVIIRNPRIIQFVIKG